MHDPWLDRLSEYIDGDMGAADVRALELHLDGCAVCRATLAELRDVVAAARSLEDRPPARDLWAGIAAAIEAGQDTMPTAAVRPDTLPIPLRPAARAARRFSFSAPQLAAAALVLMTVSAGAAWLLGGAGSDSTVYEQGAIFHAAGSPPAEVSRVGTAAPQPAPPSAAGMDEALAAARSTLDPVTVEVLERSIESINAAIADAHAALEADPGNPYLQRQLDSTLQRRQDVIRRASRVQRAGT